MSGDLFLGKWFPHLYEGVLRLPVIRSIRRQERELLHRTFIENLHSTDEILEVGAGTGYYTFEMARLVRQVTALERAAGMTAILKKRIALSDAPNVTVVDCDFFSYSPGKTFDAVIAIGVLDSIVEWRAFLDHCLSLAGRCVIFTIPRSSFWAGIHSFFGGAIGVNVRVYKPEDLTRHLGRHRLRLYETGLQTRWTHGLTMVAIVDVQETHNERKIGEGFSV